MPGGDAQRVWFPEMVERLRWGWHEGVPLDALVVLRDELDAMLADIRSTGQIRTPITTCLRCGHTGRQPEPHVSVRALILALARFSIVSTAGPRKGLGGTSAAARPGPVRPACGPDTHRTVWVWEVIRLVSMLAQTWVLSHEFPEAAVNQGSGRSIYTGRPAWTDGCSRLVWPRSTRGRRSNVAVFLPHVERAVIDIALMATACAVALAVSMISAAPSGKAH